MASLAYRVKICVINFSLLKSACFCVSVFSNFGFRLFRSLRRFGFSRQVFRFTSSSLFQFHRVCRLFTFWLPPQSVAASRFLCPRFCGGTLSKAGFRFQRLLHSSNFYAIMAPGLFGRRGGWLKAASLAGQNRTNKACSGRRGVCGLSK